MIELSLGPLVRVSGAVASWLSCCSEGEYRLVSALFCEKDTGCHSYHHAKLFGEAAVNSAGFCLDHLALVGCILDTIF